MSFRVPQGFYVSAIQTPTYYVSSSSNPSLPPPTNYNHAEAQSAYESIVKAEIEYQWKNAWCF